MDVDLAVDAVKALSGKGVLPVLAELARGTRRHNELARAVKVDHKTLDKTLRRLQDVHLVVREVHPVPLRVNYRLTAQARRVLHSVADLTTVWQTVTCARSETDEQRYPATVRTAS